MKRRLPLIIAAVACLWSTTALAEGELLPPDIDFAKVCKVKERINKPSRDWTGWNGKKSSLSSDQLIELGMLYRFGSKGTAKQPELGAKFFRLVAKRGDTRSPKAMNLYAQMLLSGDGVTQDTEQAMAYFEKALAGGRYKAAHYLGEIYLGFGDYTKAEYYFKQSAATGYPKSVLALAYLYKEGLVTPPADQAVDNLYTLAQNMLLERVAKGDCVSLYDIGLIYFKGELVPRNYTVAAKWLEASASTGLTNPMLVLAELYRSSSVEGVGLERVITLWQTAAATGSREAMYHLGMSYMLGEGVGVDRTTGLDWLSKSAARGELDAMEALAHAFSGEYGVEKNPKQAAEWMIKAARHKDVSSEILLMLGHAYETGTGLKQDLRQAFLNYERAAKAGSRSGVVRLAESHMQGRGTNQHAKKALKFYRLAASRGSNHAMRKMAHIYRCGTGVPQDMEKSYKWLERAVANKSGAALLEVATLRFEEGKEQEGLHFLERAAELGNRKAMATLSVYYLKQGDKDKAETWEDAATDDGKGERAGWLKLGKLYAHDGLDADKAVDFFEEAIDLGSAAAMYEYAKHLETGRYGMPLDKEEAQELLQQSADAGFAKALYWLGKEALKSEDGKTQEKSIPLLEKAAGGGEIRAMTLLAELYSKGVGTIAVSREKSAEWMDKAVHAYPCKAHDIAAVAKNYAKGVGTRQNAHKALDLYLRAAELGSPNAMRELGRMYARGLGVKPAPEKSIDWFRQGAEKGDAASMLELANAYASGYGIATSPELAMEWWKKAADAGNEEARTQLKQMQATGYGE